MDVALKACFGDPSLEVMNFLNEVVLRYPQAVSFAPGRPAERHFDVEGSLAQVPRYVEHRTAETGWAPAAVWNDLGQYNKTNGIINGLIARQLALDEGIKVDPASIVVTVGCQEGMTVLLLGLFEPGDVLLVSDPTYIGITGLATIMGIPVVAIPTGENGLEAAKVAEAIEAVRRSGRRPRAVYDIPDFNNPLGTRMPLEARRELLRVAREQEILILEDNPYGMFSYDGHPLPTLKAMDEDGLVIYMGSFSKTLYPGLRVGYLVADQKVEARAGGPPTTLAAELSKVKSLTTVTSSPVTQAVVGAALLEHGGSLRRLVETKLPFYRGNRDAMVTALERELGELAGVKWNRPEGGFFLTLTLPFDFDEQCLQSCARDHGVIVCPMSFFSLAGGREREVRLSFSYVTPEQIDDGIRRFAAFVKGRLA